MRLGAQWVEVERELPERWIDARFLLTLENEADAARAAALLGPLNPGRSGERVRFGAARASGVGADGVRRLLQRLDAERIRGSLEVVDATAPHAGVEQPTPPPGAARVSLVASWDAAVRGLPDDWSDLYVEIELRSSDYLERAALLLAPVNPLRDGDRLAFRFRVARRFGYGASGGMARRCLERCDREGIGGVVRILRALSDTDPVKTQGPVWYVGGRAV